MGKADIAAKKEKTLAEQLIIVVLIAVLMAIFWLEFEENEQVIENTGFEAMSNAFSTKVQLVHAQWLMDKQPSKVMVKNSYGQVEVIAVNKKGWVDAVDAQQPCVDIWRQVMNLPLIFIKQPISVIAVNRMQSVKNSVCRYALNGSTYFEYDKNTGKLVSNLM